MRPRSLWGSTQGVGWDEQPWFLSVGRPKWSREGCVRRGSVRLECVRLRALPRRPKFGTRVCKTEGKDGLCVSRFSQRQSESFAFILNMQCIKKNVFY